MHTHALCTNGDSVIYQLLRALGSTTRSNYLPTARPQYSTSCCGTLFMSVLRQAVSTDGSLCVYQFSFSTLFGIQTSVE